MSSFKTYPPLKLIWVTMAFAILISAIFIIRARRLATDTLDSAFVRDAVRLRVDDELAQKRTLSVTAMKWKEIAPSYASCLPGPTAQAKGVEPLQADFKCKNMDLQPLPLFVQVDSGVVMLLGTDETASCFDPNGTPVSLTRLSEDECVAEGSSQIAFVCPQGAEFCEVASQMLVSYVLKFRSGETIQRTVLLDLSVD